jgi:hypothetical protein
MTSFKLSAQDATYLIALLEADRQTALQLLLLIIFTNHRFCLV